MSSRNGSINTTVEKENVLSRWREVRDEPEDHSRQRESEP